jgi:hypothetical protein
MPSTVHHVHCSAKRMTVSLFLEHDLFGKPVSTFPDHAPNRLRQM